MTDYVYGIVVPGGDPPFSATAVDWRDPVMTWTESLGTTVDDPRENYLVPPPRGD
jgi:hypothetical protein